MLHAVGAGPRDGLTIGLPTRAIVAAGTGFTGGRFAPGSCQRLRDARMARRAGRAGLSQSLPMRHRRQRGRTSRIHVRSGTEACYTGGIRSSSPAAPGVAAAGATCLAVAVAAWLAMGAASSQPRAPRPSRRPSAGLPRVAPQAEGRAGLVQVAADLNRAEQLIHDPGAAPRALAWAGLAEEIGTGVLAREPVGRRRATLALTDPQARASVRTDLAAAAALAGLGEHRTRLPPWRIIAPPPAPTLLALFRTAQARFGVPWPYLAAIELVETRFGRIRGPSSAGAQGPMQFLPATWARYGHGSIDNPRAAILAAARLLAANGAPADMAGALRHYNDSQGYVIAVTGRSVPTRSRRTGASVRPTSS